MHKYKTLFINDIRHSLSDPMLMACVFGPLALLLVARFGFPAVRDWLFTAYAFDLGDYALFTLIFLAAVIPLLIGTLTGLLMLDERDEQLIAVLSVTPLTRRGYLLYRLLLPTALCLIWSTIFLAFSGLSTFRLASVYSLVLLALEAPWFALLLVSFASNKVEGLAYSKLGGLLIGGPIAAYFVAGGWQWLGAWIPTYWAAKPLLLGASGDQHLSGGSFAAGLLFHLLLLWLMMSIFFKRSD